MPYSSLLELTKIRYWVTSLGQNFLPEKVAFHDLVDIYCTSTPSPSLNVELGYLVCHVETKYVSRAPATAPQSQRTAVPSSSLLL